MKPIDFKEPKIADVVPYGNLAVEKLKHNKFEQATKYKPTLPILEENALVGIEVEVENIRNGCYADYYWKIKEDNSLRNYGMEFASIPLRMYQVESALNYLKERVEEENNPDFSPRTSIHVHINVRDMCWEQIKNFILLYAIFERHFFNIAGTKRESSVFCVPLYKTNALQSLPQMEYDNIKWHKYSAINPGTILGNGDVPKFGTIEFRHLYGTLDKKVIINWLNNIMCLRRASRCFRHDELLEKVKQLNTTSEYVGLYNAIFGEYADNVLMSKHDFEHCVSTTKLVLWGNKWKTLYPCSVVSAFYKYYEADQTQKKILKTAFVHKTVPPLQVNTMDDIEPLEQIQVNTMDDIEPLEQMFTEAVHKVTAQQKIHAMNWNLNQTLVGGI